MIPPIYNDSFGLGLPLRWQDEQSGELVAAVLAYFEKKLLTERQFALVRAYCIHYINAPCWAEKGCQGDPECLDALSGLRDGANKLARQEDILPWIYECLDMGMDPL